MDPITAGAISGGMGIAGSFIQGEYARKNQEDAENFADKMSSTAHQREVSDLRAAGLNPILSALGSGASAPSLSAAPAPDFSTPMSSAVQTAQQQQAQNATVENVKAQTTNTQEDSTNKAKIREVMDNQIAASAAQIENTKLNNAIIRSTAKSAIKKANAEGNMAPAMELLKAINLGTGAAKNLVPLIP